jgi:hypothetical protein
MRSTDCASAREGCPRGRTLIVIDGRGAEDARLAWVPLLVGIDPGR